MNNFSLSEVEEDTFALHRWLHKDGAIYIHFIADKDDACNMDKCVDGISYPYGELFCSIYDITIERVKSL